MNRAPSGGRRVSVRPGQKAAPPAGRLLLLSAFAVALGHAEAVVAVHLREAPRLSAPAEASPESAPALPGWIMAVDQTRQAGVLLMLLCVSLLSGRTFLERLGAFLLALGVGQVVYQLAFSLMTRWPPALGEGERWLLAPGPWQAPAWALLVVSCVLVAVGILCFRRR